MLTFLNHDASTEETTTPQTEMTLSDLIGFGDVMKQLNDLSLYSKEVQDWSAKGGRLKRLWIDRRHQTVSKPAATAVLRFFLSYPMLNPSDGVIYVIGICRAPFHREGFLQRQWF